MPAEVSITRKKKIWYYLPYGPVLCFCAEIIGLAVWDVYSRQVLGAAKRSLTALNVKVDTGLVWGGTAVAATTALIVILALCMLALGIGRSFIAYTADRTGATRMGGRLVAWMWFDAVFIVIWFITTIWLLILLLGQCLFMAVTWSLTVAIKVGSKFARNAAALGVANVTITYDAGSVWGSSLMLVAGIWILMQAGAEFGVTRRERQLLRRIAKAKMMPGGGEMSKLLPNGSSSGSLFGKGKKSSSKAQLSDSQEAVIVDHETGEIIEVQSMASTTTGANANSSSGKGSSSSPLIKGTKSLAKGFTKSIAKTSQVFEVLGGLFTPKGRAK